jgi:transketolase
LPARRTNENLAGFFEVTRRTIDNWIATVPEFAPTVRTDRVLADAMVTRGLYTRAGGLRPRGQAYPECRGEKKTVITTLHLPPDTQACVFWLRNRCREHWCDRLEPVTEGTTNWSPCSMPPARGRVMPSKSERARCRSLDARRRQPERFQPRDRRHDSDDSGLFRRGRRRQPNVLTASNGDSIPTHMKNAALLNYGTDLDSVQLEPLDERSRYLRRLIFRAIENGGRGHIGPALSLVEIIRVLYDDFLRYDPVKPDWRERDRFVLSKGHGCLALYAVLADRGFFPLEELDRFCHYDSFLGGHPETVVPGVEACTGALGHGLSIGLGMALAARMTGRDSKVYVLMGDGEINEGSVWEAAACADKHRLSNLTAIIDYNKIQSAGSVFDIQSMEPLADKWTSFGFRVSECNGHNVDELRQVFREAAAALGDRPRAIICHTVKGKGIPVAENNAGWHHKSDLSEKDLLAIRGALGS